MCLPFVEDTPLKSTQASLAEKADLTLNTLSHPSPGTLPSEPQEVPSTEADLSCLTYADRKKKISRVSRYEEVMVLYREGMGQRAIAREFHLSRNTVRRYVSSPTFPERTEDSPRHTKGASKLDPYLPYLPEQWKAGLQNNTQLFAAIKARGYTGC
jgi:hypothetical protein